MATEYKLRSRDIIRGQPVVWSPDHDDLSSLPSKFETIYYRCGQCGIIFGASPHITVDRNTAIRCQNCGAYNSL